MKLPFIIVYLPPLKLLPIPNIRLYQIGYCDGNAVKLLSTPNIYAAVGATVQYDVDASGNPLPTYSLIEKPTSMVIDASTGSYHLDSYFGFPKWTCNCKGSNTGGSVDQTFNIFHCRRARHAVQTCWLTGISMKPVQLLTIDRIANYKLTGANPSHATGRVGTGLSFNGSSDSMNMAGSCRTFKDIL